VGRTLLSQTHSPAHQVVRRKTSGYRRAAGIDFFIFLLYLLGCCCKSLLLINLYLFQRQHSQLLFMLDEILVPICLPGLKKTNKKILLKEELSEDCGGDVNVPRS